NNATGISATNAGGITVNANVSNSAGGNITLTTTGTTGDIAIAANKSVTITGGNGVMTLNAGRTISFGAGAGVGTTNRASVVAGTFGTGTGTVTLNASQAAPGNITLAGDSLI